MLDLKVISQPKQTKREEAITKLENNQREIRFRTSLCRHNQLTQHQFPHLAYGTMYLLYVHS